MFMPVLSSSPAYVLPEATNNECIRITIIFSIVVFSSVFVDETTKTKKCRLSSNGTL